MSKQADRDGFIVAYPTGTAATWNAGDCCGPAYDAKVDDIAYLRALIQKIESQYNIDRDKIYIAGLSNGGMLAYRAGAELSDIVAAIAPVAGCMFPPKTGVKEPVSVICFNGTADKLVPIAGGGQCWFFSVHATPTAEAVDFWVHRDHCASDPICETTGHVMRQLYKGGSDGTEVCVYTLAGGGHHWPGGRTAGSIFGDKPSSEISATEVMCQFFWSHPKQHNENPG
jgi:polyhydroxybutyrate depolymerase